MIENQHTPIFITGVERSGSSIIARIIKSCNVFTGDTTNMAENILIKKFVDNYYKSIGADIRGQYPLPNTQKLSIPCDWKTSIDSLLVKQYYKNKKQWMYKSSRLAQIWPIWNYAYPNAKWIIVRRRTADVIASCEKTAFMDAFENPNTINKYNILSGRDGWSWWIKQHNTLFVEMMEKGINLKQIWPERVSGGNYEQIHEMLDWLGLSWNKDIDKLLDLIKIECKNR